MLKRHWTAAIPTVFTILFGYYWLGGTAPNRTPQGTMVFQLTTDADLFVDGKQIKLSRNVDSDISEIDVTPGEHQIQVKYNDGRIATKSVWVRDNERMEIKIELKKANEQVVATNSSKATSTTPQSTRTSVSNNVPIETHAKDVTERESSTKEHAGATITEGNLEVETLPTGIRKTGTSLTYPGGQILRILLNQFDGSVVAAISNVRSLKSGIEKGNYSICIWRKDQARAHIRLPVDWDPRGLVVDETWRYLAYIEGYKWSKTIHVYDLSNREEVNSFELTDNQGGSYVLAFKKGSHNELLSVRADGGVRCWNWITGSEIPYKQMR